MRFKEKDENRSESLTNYYYQILMRCNPSETGIQIMFTPGFQAIHPLGDKDKLGSDAFPVPFTFMYGDDDWVTYIDEDWP